MMIFRKRKNKENKDNDQSIELSDLVDTKSIQSNEIEGNSDLDESLIIKQDISLEESNDLLDPNYVNFVNLHANPSIQDRCAATISSIRRSFKESIPNLKYQEGSKYFNANLFIPSEAVKIYEQAFKNAIELEIFYENFFYNLKIIQQERGSNINFKNASNQIIEDTYISAPTISTRVGERCYGSTPFGNIGAVVKLFGEVETESFSLEIGSRKTKATNNGILNLQGNISEERQRDDMAYDVIKNLLITNYNLITRKAKNLLDLRANVLAWTGNIASQIEQRISNEIGEYRTLNQDINKAKYHIEKLESICEKYDGLSTDKQKEIEMDYVMASDELSLIHPDTIHFIKNYQPRVSESDIIAKLNFVAERKNDLGLVHTYVKTPDEIDKKRDRILEEVVNESGLPIKNPLIQFLDQLRRLEPLFRSEEMANYVKPLDAEYKSKLDGLKNEDDKRELEDLHKKTKYFEHLGLTIVYDRKNSDYRLMKNLIQPSLDNPNKFFENEAFLELGQENFPIFGFIENNDYVNSEILESNKSLLRKIESEKDVYIGPFTLPMVYNLGLLLFSDIKAYGRGLTTSAIRSEKKFNADSFKEHYLK